MAPSKKKTFAAALASTPPMAPPATKPQTAWEIFFMGELKRMQHEISDLKAEIVTKEERILKLETHLQEMEENQQIQKAAQEEIARQHQEYAEKEKQEPESFVNEVLSVVKESERVKSLERYVRVGGLPEDWSVGTDSDEQLEGYILDVDVLKERLTKVVPFVDLGEPVSIEVKGKQAKVGYYDIDDKIKLMKQTKSLKGTTVWISDELTPTQLKNRAKELAKVREARKQGKWAVYRGGKAIIKDFKNPTPPSKRH